MLAAKLMTADAQLPTGWNLVGYIATHPSDDHGPGYAVIQSGLGFESAWNGRTIRSLPRDWRKRVEFETA